LNIGDLVLSNNYKEVVAPILIKKVFENIEKLIKSFTKEFKIETQELKLIYPESTAEWSVVFKIKGLVGSKKEFSFPSLKSVTLTSFPSLENLTPRAILIYQGEGFSISYKNLEKDVYYILTVKFDIGDNVPLENLLYKKVQEDTLPEYRKYWMEAQLKFVDFFEKQFNNVRLEDLNFLVDVNVYENIETKVPSAFRKELEVIVKWMKETERGRKFQLTWEHLKLLRQRRGGEMRSSHILEVIRELQDLFHSQTFKNFLKTEQDFHYHDCLRGTDYYSAPFPTWPKFMRVITKTSLNLDKPAAHGYLYYDYQSFRKKVEDIFGEFL